MTTGSTIHGFTSNGSVSVERRERCRVQDRCANLESMPQLLGPLLPKPRGRDDERVLAPAALVQLREHEAGLNGLAEADLVGQEQSRGVPANQRQGRLELKRKDVYRGAERRPQLAEGPQIGSLRVQVAHPLSSRRRSDSVSASCRDRAVEWSEQAAAAERSLLVGVGQVEQRDVGERRRLLHDPSFASHRDAVAGGKGHALPRGNAHTVEKLPGMSGIYAFRMAIVAPKCDASSSKNCNTRGCRSRVCWTMPRWTPVPRP